MRGLFVDELENQATNLWLDRIKLTNDYAATGFLNNSSYLILSNFILDYRRGGRWFERPWYYSLPPEKGGAPRPRVYDLDHVAIDLWFLEIDSKMKIKAKEFSFTLSRDGRFYDPNYWKVRIRPQISLGLPNGIRRAGFSISFEYYFHQNKIIEVEPYIRYRDKNIWIGIEISFVRW